MKIFLVGPSGTGKSTIGKQLANRLEVDFIDTDRVIEKQEGVTIFDYFQKEGEPKFRTLEAELTMKLIGNESLSGVVSTGGGLPCHSNLMNSMLNTGIVIQLQLPKEILISRLKKSYNRPLLQSKLEERVEQQLRERSEFYNLSHLSIDTLNWNAEKMDVLIESLDQINPV